MISIDEMQQMLCELIDELPEAFFENLSGGVSLLAQAKRNPQAAPEDELYILGEYHTGGHLGNAIFLYYGSFERVYGHLSTLSLRRELRATLRHEFRHHVEGMAGVDDLIREDQRQLADYRARRPKGYEQAHQDGLLEGLHFRKRKPDLPK